MLVCLSSARGYILAAWPAENSFRQWVISQNRCGQDHLITARGGRADHHDFIVARFEYIAVKIQRAIMMSRAQKPAEYSCVVICKGTMERSDSCRHLGRASRTSVHLKIRRKWQ